MRFSTLLPMPIRSIFACSLTDFHLTIAGNIFSDRTWRTRHSRPTKLQLHRAVGQSDWVLHGSKLKISQLRSLTPKLHGCRDSQSFHSLWTDASIWAARAKRENCSAMNWRGKRERNSIFRRLKSWCDICSKINSSSCGLGAFYLVNNGHYPHPVSTQHHELLLSPCSRKTLQWMNYSNINVHYFVISSTLFRGRVQCGLKFIRNMESSHNYKFIHVKHAKRISFVEM